MKNIRVFLSENFQYFEVKFSIYLNRRVFVMKISAALVKYGFHDQRQNKMVTKSAVTNHHCSKEIFYPSDQTYTR